MNRVSIACFYTGRRLTHGTLLCSITTEAYCLRLRSKHEKVDVRTQLQPSHGTK